MNNYKTFIKKMKLLSISIMKTCSFIKIKTGYSRAIAYLKYMTLALIFVSIIIKSKYHIKKY
jgi:hypothetical protein